MVTDPTSRRDTIELEDTGIHMVGGMIVDERENNMVFQVVDERTAPGRMMSEVQPACRKSAVTISSTSAELAVIVGDMVATLEHLYEFAPMTRDNMTRVENSIQLYRHWMSKRDVPKPEKERMPSGASWRDGP